MQSAPGFRAVAFAATLAAAVVVSPSSSATPGDAGSRGPAASSPVGGIKVGPPNSFVDQRGGIHASFVIVAQAPLDLVVVFAIEGWRVRRFEIAAAEPGVRYTVRWSGLLGSGKPGRDGKYEVAVESELGSSPLGSFDFHRDRFPVRGKHGTRGPIGEFHAPRSGGRTHEGFDIGARCGTRLVAARGGRVLRRGFDPALFGNFVLIRTSGSRLTHFYSHLIAPSPLRGRERVHTGDPVGRVGQTGNARTTPCHLHFEIRRRGRAIDPGPLLRRWDRYS